MADRAIDFFTSNGAKIPIHEGETKEQALERHNAEHQEKDSHQQVNDNLRNAVDNKNNGLKEKATQRLKENRKSKTINSSLTNIKVTNSPAFEKLSKANKEEIRSAIMMKISDEKRKYVNYEISSIEIALKIGYKLVEFQIMNLKEREIKILRVKKLGGRKKWRK